jgi:hypothetical protein
MSSLPPVEAAFRFYTFFYVGPSAGVTLRTDIFHDKNVITRPHGRCNDRPAAAELK